MTGRRLGALIVGMALVAMPAVALAEASGADSPLALDRLAPGVSRQGTISVTNPSDQRVTIALAAKNLRDDDNGCVRPETRDGDTTCGDDGGELSRWLDVSIADGANGSAFITLSTVVGSTPAGMYAPARKPSTVPSTVLSAANAEVVRRKVVMNAEKAEKAAQDSAMYPMSVSDSVQPRNGPPSARITTWPSTATTSERANAITSDEPR